MPKQKRNRGKKNLKGNISCYNLDAALSATEDSLFFYCFLVSLLVFFIYLVFFSRPTTQPSKLTISFKRLAKLSRGGKKKEGAGGGPLGEETVLSPSCGNYYVSRLAAIREWAYTGRKAGSACLQLIVRELKKVSAA